MGDRSPKSLQKNASQKKNKVESADQKKKSDLALKAKAAVDDAHAEGAAIGRHVLDLDQLAGHFPDCRAAGRFPRFVA